MRLYKYHGAGNDFLIVNNIEVTGEATFSLSEADIRLLCDRHFGLGADGLMILTGASAPYDFGMEYYNSDGSGGMMCGNGGRCIVAFAYDNGFRSFDFIAPDGPHTAKVLSVDGTEKIVRLGMKDVDIVESLERNDFFLDTGTRHFVRFVESPEKVVITDEAINLRHDERFQPVGTNVNIAFYDGEGIMVRTFEKGVEAETMACGTGIVATALVAVLRYDIKSSHVNVKSPGGEFVVEFVRTSKGFINIYLTGPTRFVGIIETPLLDK